MVLRRNGKNQARNSKKKLYKSLSQEMTTVIIRKENRTKVLNNYRIRFHFLFLTKRAVILTS